MEFISLSSHESTTGDLNQNQQFIFTKQHLKLNKKKSNF